MVVAAPGCGWASGSLGLLFEAGDSDLEAFGVVAAGVVDEFGAQVAGGEALVDLAEEVDGDLVLAPFAPGGVLDAQHGDLAELAGALLVADQILGHEIGGRGGVAPAGRGATRRGRLWCWGC